MFASRCLGQSLGTYAACTREHAWSIRRTLNVKAGSYAQPRAKPARPGASVKPTTKWNSDVPKPSNRPGKYIPVKKRLESINTTIRHIPKPKVPKEAPREKPAQVKSLAAAAANMTFEDMQLDPEVLDAALQGVLNEVSDPKPTEIQALGIPQIINRRYRHILCAAETGTGKTLTYLLPTIHNLRLDEKSDSSIRQLDHPRAIVLVPTRELVDQVQSVAKHLSHKVKFRTVAVHNGVSRTRFVRSLAAGPVDILIATPTTLLHYIEDGTISIARSRYLILDEADSLFDAGWGKECTSVISSIRENATKMRVSYQIIVVSATLPRSVSSRLDTLLNEHGELQKITTPSLHRSLPNLQQSFIDLSKYNGNRQMALLDVLKRNRKDEKTMVFSNTKGSVQVLHRFLQSKGIESLALYKDAPMPRSKTLALFAGTGSAGTSASAEENNKESESETLNSKLLLCTDLASRGMDTTFVDHVILYDFPSSAIDYLHRVGRTARAGHRGKATALVGRKDRALADRIRVAIRKATILT